MNMKRTMKGKFTNSVRNSPIELIRPWRVMFLLLLLISIGHRNNLGFKSSRAAHNREIRFAERRDDEDFGQRR